MRTLADKRIQWPTLFREWFCNSEANSHEICTRLRQRVKNKVSRISSESVKSHSMKLAMMFKLDLTKMTLIAFRTPVRNGLIQKVNIFRTENEHLHAFYAPTKNRTNWIRASSYFLCLKKIGHYFWRRVYIYRFYQFSTQQVVKNHHARSTYYPTQSVPWQLVFLWRRKEPGHVETQHQKHLTIFLEHLGLVLWMTENGTFRTWIELNFCVLHCFEETRMCICSLCHSSTSKSKDI